MFADFSAGICYPSSSLPESSVLAERFRLFCVSESPDAQGLYRALVRRFGREIPEIQEKEQRKDNTDKIDRAAITSAVTTARTFRSTLWPNTCRFTRAT